jgi:glycosyltransferase involved in cell wall biosynthesis
VASTHSDRETHREMHAAAPAIDITIVAHDIGSVGGMERVLAELLMGLRASGHEVSVIARTCELPEGSGVRFHRVRAPGRPFVLAYPWFLVTGSLAVRRHRRGVVQSTGAIVLNRVDVLAVHYLHQVGPVNPKRESGLFRANAALAGLMKRVGERLCMRINHPRAVVCVSEGVAGEVRAQFPAVADRVMTIHNGVDTADFAPGSRREQALAERERIGAAPGDLIAAFVGSEWERKGLEPAIRAIALGEAWSLVVAGSGDQARYRALADSLGVGGRVHFLGVREDVQLIYKMCDAFILPSSYETFSLVTFEAAASGLAILAAPVSGVRELIEDGRNGFLISRDPEMIAERLARLAADAELRASLGAAARESALGFSWERMVADHERLYAQLAAG